MPSTFVPLRMTSASDLHRAECCRRIGREVRAPGAGREDDDPPFFKVPDRAAPDERLGHGAHLDRGHHAGDDAVLLERVLQSQGIDDGCQHAHVVSRGPVHPTGAGCEASEDIASADDDGSLDAQSLDLSHVQRDSRRDGRVDPDIAGRP